MPSGQNYFALAQAQASLAADLGEVPVGAIIVKDQEIIAIGHNRTIRDADPTAHAEIVVMRDAARQLGDARLSECDLYVTLEPCAMCAAAISHARIRRLYYGAYDAKGGAVDHGPRWFQQPTCLHVPEIYGGIAELDNAVQLQQFFQERR